MTYTRALIVREPYASLIVEGVKTWELRKSACHRRGRVGIIAQGTGTIIGSVCITDSRVVPVDELKTAVARARHHATDHFVDAYYANLDTGHAWSLSEATKFEDPLPYVHKPGQVIWVVVA